MKKALILLCLPLLLASLACNLPLLRSVPPAETPSIPTPAQMSESLATVVSQPTAQPTPEPGIQPSGYPTYTLEGGSGYLFQTNTVVTGSDDRDVWWNAAGFVPNSVMGSMGVLNSPADVTAFSQAALAYDQFEPVPGEVFVVEVGRAQIYAVLRVLSIDSEARVTFEYLFPYAGTVNP